MSAGPPPVPGGRTPEEREAARREREARRSAPGAAPAPARDWLDDARRLTAPRATSSNGGGGAPTAPRRRPGRLLAALAACLLALAAAWLALSLLQPFKGEGEGSVRVVVPKGSTLGEIATLLERRGVISSASFFELRARLSGRSGSLKPGPYRLRRDMSFAAALDALERGVPPDVVVVTIPEGLSRAEIAPIVKGKLRGRYLRATRGSDEIDLARYRAGGARNLEGFLFPATYELKKGQTVRRLVSQQLEAFRDSFGRLDLSFARSRNLTPYDVLVIASMVEREAQLDRERPLVASVIYNRLQQGIHLGIDATIRFALDQWTEPLKESELATPSPYNTRTNAGLPPGPIGNPGLASLEAAARPARTDHLFYVVKPGTCGAHAFSETDAEFQRDVARYNAERARRGGKSPTTC